MVDREYLTARQVMDLFHVSKNTLYSGPLRKFAVAVGKSRGLRWPLKRLIDWEIEATCTPVPDDPDHSDES